MDKPDEAELSDAATEARVRRSLGLGPTPTNNGPSHSQTSHGHGGHNGGYGANGGNGQPRRRFVRDGEVPVVILHPKSENDTRQATALSDMLRQRDFERAGRIRAETALQEAQATIHGLQTRLAHADMERQERAATAEAPPITQPRIAPDTTAESTAATNDEPIKWWREPGEPERTRR